MSVELIQKYFPDLSELQIDQFSKLDELYKEWNEKINVISRKDMDSLYEKHVLHSLGIAKVMQFSPQTKVLDIGTGGGFPGIPLAILFPEVHFTLVDSIGKKITVVKEVSEGIGLKYNPDSRKSRRCKRSVSFYCKQSRDTNACFSAVVKRKIRKRTV